METITSARTTPQQQIANYFGVNDLRKIVYAPEFKELAKKATGYFVNREDDHSYLWIINRQGMNGYALDGDQLKLWKSRTIHEVKF